MISVCMATYNGERFLKQQLDSILCQLSPEDELIISDDGSTDKTLDIIHSYKDKRITLLHHQKNPAFTKIKHSRSFYYASDNFQNALKRAKGDYIFLSDQDDVWIDTKIETVIVFLQKTDIVMTNFRLINSEGKIITNSFYEKSPISRFLFINILHSRFLGCCMAFRRTVLDYALPFPSKLIAHDFWLGCLGVSKFHFIFIDTPLLSYRRTGKNVSTSTEFSGNSLLYKIHYRFIFFMQIILHSVIKKHSTN